MTNPVAQVTDVVHGEWKYKHIWLWCPGCEHYRDGDPEPAGGLHALPITGSGTIPGPSWNFDGNLEAVRSTHGDGSMVSWSMQVCSCATRSLWPGSGSSSVTALTSTPTSTCQ